TDKVDTEVPSPGSGTLTEILVQEGETVEVGTKLAVIGGDGADGASGSEPQAQEAPPEPAPRDEAPPRPEQPAEPAAAAQTNGKTFVSPVVAKIASEHGVDPSQVPGTGRGGRVTKKDILNFIESGAPAVPAEPAAPQPTAPPLAAPPPPPAPAAAPAHAGEGFEPITAMRKGIT